MALCASWLQRRWSASCSRYSDVLSARRKAYPPNQRHQSSVQFHSIDGFRWCLLRGQSKLYMPGFILSTVVAIVFTAAGVWYFRKTERTFADLI